MNEEIETTEETEENVSRKRQVGATLASAGVTIVLGLAANTLIGLVGTRLHDRIANTKKNA